MLAIILAGGKGERLRPLTDNIPKVLIPVHGRALLEHVIELLKTAGVDEVILSTAYLSDQVEKYFAARDVGVVIRYLVETRPRGTAGPLMILKEAGKIPTEDFFLVNGDNLFSCNLAEMAAFHQSHPGYATNALYEVSDPTAFGVARLDGNRIIEFVEKPVRDQAPSNLINSGYSVLSPEVFEFVPDQEFAMYERDVYPALACRGKLYAYRGKGQWFDTGTAERYAQVQREWRGVPPGRKGGKKR